MLQPVVDHMAALAEGSEVGVSVVRGVVIAMGSGKNDPRSSSLTEDVDPCCDPDPSPPAVTPASDICVPPAAIAEVVDHPPVRPSAALTAASRSPEPDRDRELRPVDGVEEAVLGPDRHALSIRSGNCPAPYGGRDLPHGCLGAHTGKLVPQRGVLGMKPPSIRRGFHPHVLSSRQLLAQLRHLEFKGEVMGIG
jgi:hypothetical protein